MLRDSIRISGKQITDYRFDSVYSKRSRYLKGFDLKWRVLDSKGLPNMARRFIPAALAVLLVRRGIYKLVNLVSNPTYQLTTLTNVTHIRKELG
jgi:hypothetical protein